MGRVGSSLSGNWFNSERELDHLCTEIGSTLSGDWIMSDERFCTREEILCRDTISISGSGAWAVMFDKKGARVRKKEAKNG